MDSEGRVGGAVIEYQRKMPYCERACSPILLETLSTRSLGLIVFSEQSESFSPRNSKFNLAPLFSLLQILNCMKCAKAVIRDLCARVRRSVLTWLGFVRAEIHLQE